MKRVRPLAPAVSTEAEASERADETGPGAPIEAEPPEDALPDTEPAPAVRPEPVALRPDPETTATDKDPQGTEAAPSRARSGPEKDPKKPAKRSKRAPILQEPKGGSRDRTEHVRRPRSDAIGAFKLERSIEKGLAQGIPNPVLAKTLGLSTRQVRRYAARVRRAWAAHVAHESYLDAALVRIGHDAQAARALGGTKGLAVALKAEALAADLVSRRAALAGSPAAEPEPLDNDRLADGLNLLAEVQQMLADEIPLGVEVEPPPTPKPPPVVVDAEAVVDASSGPGAPPNPNPATVVEVVERTETTATIVQRTVRYDSAGRLIDEHGFTSPGQARAYARARGLPRPLDND